MRKRATPYWTRVIERAKERKQKGLVPFTELQRAKAADWVTCACGKQDRRIRRGTWGAPEDFALENLGCDFAGAVEAGATRDAAIILAKIERRAAELLRAEAVTVEG